MKQRNFQLIAIFIFAIFISLLIFIFHRHVDESDNSFVKLSKSLRQDNQVSITSKQVPSNHIWGEDLSSNLASYDKEELYASFINDGSNLTTGHGSDFGNGISSDIVNLSSTFNSSISPSLIDNVTIPVHSTYQSNEPIVIPKPPSLDIDDTVIRLNVSRIGIVDNFQIDIDSNSNVTSVITNEPISIDSPSPSFSPTTSFPSDSLPASYSLHPFINFTDFITIDNHTTLVPSLFTSEVSSHNIVPNQAESSPGMSRIDLNHYNVSDILYTSVIIDSVVNTTFIVNNTEISKGNHISRIYEKFMESIETKFNTNISTESNFDIIDKLYKALTTGDPYATTFAQYLNYATMNTVQSIVEVVQQSSSNTFIEITDCDPRNSVYADDVANRSSLINSVLIRIPCSKDLKSNDDDNYVDIDEKSNTAKNIHDDVWHNRNVYIASTLGVTTASPHYVFDCIQIIKDLAIIMSDMLPYEFEMLFGNLLCRCEYTILSKDLPSIAYFSYWESIQSLVLNSMTAIGNLCDVSLDSTSSSTFGVNLKMQSFVAVKRTSVKKELTIKDYFDLNDILELNLDYISKRNIFYGLSYQANYLQDSRELQTIKQNEFTSSTTSVSTTHTSSSYSNLFHYSTPTTFPIYSSWLGTPTSRPTQFESHIDTHDCSLPHVDVANVNAINLNDLFASYVLRGVYVVSKCENGSIFSAKSDLSMPTSIPVVDQSSQSLNPLNSIFSGTTLFADNMTEPTDSPTVMPSFLPDLSIPPTTNPISISAQLSTSRRRLSIFTPTKSSVTIDKSALDIPLHSELNEFISSSFPIEANLGSYEWNLTNSETKSSANMDSMFESSSSRQHLRLLQIREFQSYKRWSTVMNDVINQFRKVKSVMLFGEHISMLSYKLASRLLARNSIVLSLMTNEKYLESHYKLVTSRKLINNFICYPQLTIPKIGAITTISEKATIAVLQIDVFLTILAEALSHNDVPSPYDFCSAGLIEQTTSQLFQLGQISLIEFPSEIVFRALISSTTTAECSAYLLGLYPNMKSLIERSSKYLQNGKYLKVEQILENTTKSYSRNDDLNDIVRSNIYRIEILNEFSKSDFVGSSKFSVYTLLHYGLMNKQKSTLLRLFIELPLWLLSTSQQSRAFPWSIFVVITSGDNPTREKYISLRFIDESMSTHKNSSFLVGVKLTGDGVKSEVLTSKLLYRVLFDEFSSHRAEVSNGRFSLVEHNSGYGFLSSRLAKSFPNATIISLEKDIDKVNFHYDMVNNLGISNNAICFKTSYFSGDDDVIFKNLYESPELFRFQIMTQSVMEIFLKTYDLPYAQTPVSSPTTSTSSRFTTVSSKSANSNWGQQMGQFLSFAVSSFISVPLASQVSLAFHVFFGFDAPKLGSASTTHAFRLRKVPDDQFLIHSHPHPLAKDFEAMWLLSKAKLATGQTEIQVSPLYSNFDGDIRRIPLIRADIVNMTRFVHHHYDYSKDGHKRTYEMHVQINQTMTNAVHKYFEYKDDSNSTRTVDISSLVAMVNASAGTTLIYSRSTWSKFGLGIGLPLGNHPNQHRIVSVGIFRENDNFFIPYTTIYAVTLISVLRLGLIPQQRDYYYKKFLSLPLYEDMAPWNIVLQGQTVDYIDYDTRDFTFDKDLPKAYQIMTVLMNYKRTVEDFHKCGSKAATVYGLPYVSDCIGKIDSSLKCNDLKLPVPCGDNTCHSTYISCLRSLAELADQIAKDAFMVPKSTTSISEEVTTEVDAFKSWKILKEGINT